MTPNSPKLPVVLAHGIARFDALWHPLARAVGCVMPLNELFDRWHYFRNIKTHLQAHGFQVFHSDVSFAGSMRERAAALATNVRQLAQATGIQEFQIIAHSMGGLDARYAIAKFGLDQYVSVLSTIGTPHNGSSFADYGLARGGDRIVKALRPFFSLDGLRDLTTTQCKQINRWAEAREATNRARYRVYAAAQRDLDRVFTPLRAPWKIIKQDEGENDGLVSINSQLWTSRLFSRGCRTSKRIEAHLFPFEADHFNECGWWDRHEPEQRATYEQRVKDFYLEIAATA